MKVRLRRDGFPVEIPWPGEGEWTTHQMRAYGTNKCCMSGWVWVAWTGNPVARNFPFGDIPERALAAAWAVAEKARQMAIARGYPSAPENSQGVIAFNNDPRTTDAMRSEFWAELWGHFGYEEQP